MIPPFPPSVPLCRGTEGGRCVCRAVADARARTELLLVAWSWPASWQSTSSQRSHDLRSHFCGKAFHGLQQAVRRETREIDAQILDTHGLIAAYPFNDTLRTAAEEVRTPALRELDGSAEGDGDRLRVASASLGQFAQRGDVLAQLLRRQIGRRTLHDWLPAVPQTRRPANSLRRVTAHPNGDTARLHRFRLALDPGKPMKSALKRGMLLS